jgi:hypothetical protein
MLVSGGGGSGCAYRVVGSGIWSNSFLLAIASAAFPSTSPDRRGRTGILVSQRLVVVYLKSGKHDPWFERVVLHSARGFVRAARRLGCSMTSPARRCWRITCCDGRIDTHHGYGHNPHLTFLP